MIYQDFNSAISAMIRFVLDRGYRIHSNYWQGINVSEMPEAEMIENLNLYFQVPLYSEPLSRYVEDICPDLPWADDHFEERVSGVPYNPPPSASWWPYAKQDNGNFKKGKIFDHTYPERFWPKLAGGRHDFDPARGIRYDYGDLNDLINLLLRDPTTRQAFLPIFFPEDTGAVENIRVPCTVGYHLIRRGDFLHIAYWIRSMDILRHARNDFYLTARLLLWVLNQLQKKEPDTWSSVRPGLFTCHCVSAHCFRGDEIALRKQL